jgi:acetyl esterase/lipase
MIPRLRNTQLVVLMAIVAAPAFTQTPKPEPDWTLLWPDGAPGALGDSAGDRPALRIYLPSDSQKADAGVVVCPGGGYGTLALDHEGRQIAEWLNERGVAAFILRYRLGPRYRHPAPLQDAQRALRYVRYHAESFGISPQKVGIWGFSAGGHLASTAGTHFDAGDPRAVDPIDRLSSRPDFMILAYPVISLAAEYTHGGSRNNLLGADPAPELLEYLSNEKQVTADTPPAFLFHTDEDKAVPAENSTVFYLALRKAKVSAELHIFQRGNHGVGLAPADPVLSIWPLLLHAWLRTNGLLPAQP